MGSRRTAALVPVVCAGLVAADLLVPPLGLDRFIPAPEDNRITAERARLGRRLFFDKRLSRDGTVACATCHDPEHGFADAKPLAIGIAGRKGTRRTPTILNRAYGKSFFWDGRTATLEEQVTMPIENPDEMDLKLDSALARIRDSYPAIDRAELARSLATYVRTILAGDAPYDRYARGQRDAMTPEQIAGLKLFRGKAGCTGCHVGPNFTDERFHNTGLPGKDRGRDGRGEFKTPTLREAANRAPYMHDGSLATLEDVIEHYDKGGEANPHLDPEMHELKLTAEEKRHLLAFLKALSGTVREGLESKSTP